MTKLRIVFLGTPDFAVESLSRIHQAGYDIAAVVTMPDKPAGRGHRMYQSPVKLYALEHGLPVLQPVSLKDPDFVEQLRALNANLFVVIAFRMLPEVVWQMPELGTFNLHASLLPLYRGAAPINRAVMNGDELTGVTTFFLKHEIDTGDVIDQRSISIGPDENVGSVHDRLMALGAELTLDTLARIAGGNLERIPQERLQGGQPTPAPKIFKDDCLIHWDKPAKEIHNLVRGLSPYPGAWSVLEINGKPAGDIKIFTTATTSGRTSDAAPGTIIVEGHSVYAVAGDGVMLHIDNLQLQGKRRMGADELLRGLRLQPGASLRLTLPSEGRC